MKNIFLFSVSIAVLASCQSSAPSEPDPATQQSQADSTEIAGVVHGFYEWYEAFNSDETTKASFTTEANGHLQLDSAAFRSYYTNFEKSGFMASSFVDDEWTFFKKCEAIWQNEPSDQPPSCLDADKYFCAQDWEPSFWVSAPVRIQSLSADRMAATMYGDYGGSPYERHFELAKENGKWLLSIIECDMGVE